jgi:hypothetical protein
VPWAAVVPCCVTVPPTADQPSLSLPFVFVSVDLLLGRASGASYSAGPSLSETFQVPDLLVICGSVEFVPSRAALSQGR